MIGTAIRSQLLGDEFGDGFKDGEDGPPKGCAFAWKNSVMGDASESLEMREDRGFSFLVSW